MPLATRRDAALPALVRERVAESLDHAVPGDPVAPEVQGPVDLGERHRRPGPHQDAERGVAQLPTTDRLRALDRRWNGRRSGEARAPHIEERVARLRGPERVADRPELAAQLRELGGETLLLPIDPACCCGQLALALEQGSAISERQQAARCGERHGTLPGSWVLGEVVAVWRRGVTLMPDGTRAGDPHPTLIPRRTESFTDSVARPRRIVRPIRPTARSAESVRRFGPTRTKGWRYVVGSRRA